MKKQFTQLFRNAINYIRGKGRNLFNRLPNEKIKSNLLQAIPFWVSSLAVGLIAVAYAKLYVWVESESHYIFQQVPWSVFIITPVCFALAWWLIVWFCPFARGSGIPQVMASIELANPKSNEKVKMLLNLRVIPFKIISSLIMVLGGGVVGREGPTIQIAASIFRKVNEWLPKWWPKISKRNMIMTGAAAGLAAAFNTPLGGIVFAVEELTKTHFGYFKTALFTAVIIAGLTSQGLLGPYLYIGYPDVSNLSNWMFVVVIGLALITGMLSAITAKIILLVMKWKTTFKNQAYLLAYVLIAGLAVASMAFFITPNVLGSGKNLMTGVLFSADKYLPWYLPFLKIFGMIFSFTTGAAGGVFAPALSAGAGIGSFISGVFHLSTTDSDLLILCGMVGFLTGVTRTPFTSAILVLEMTDKHSVIFQLLLAGMFANFAAYAIDRHSFYDRLKHQYLHDIHKIWTTRSHENPKHSGSELTDKEMIH